MKWIKILIVTVGLWSVAESEAKAQIDTLFWFAAPWVTPDHDNNVQMSYRISTFANPATVRIQQPEATYDVTFTIPANSLFSVPLETIVADLESGPADMVLNSGFKITSDEFITVVYDFISDTVTISPGNANNPETYSLKGQNGMGTEFVVPFQTLWNNRLLTTDRNGDAVITQPKQFFSVVATEDNTTIYITPRCPVVGGYPADVTYSVFLPNAGDVYTCENITQITNVAGSNLSGSIVTSDKPVSVTINDDSVNPSGGGGCFDLMGDQIVPTDVIGQDYIINEGFLNAGSNESIFIVATENFTSVTLNDGASSSALLNQGDTYQYSIDAPLTSVQADKPVYVIHMSGYGCELGMAIIPPSNCAGSNQVSFSRNNDVSFLLNILCPAGTEGDFTLNASPALVPAAAFSPVPGTGGAWMGAQISYSTAEITPGSANIIQNSSDFFSLGIINGSATGGCLYHYMSSFHRKVIVDAGNDTTLCTSETTINLDGSVQGGTTTGLWSILDGTGTIDNSTDLSTFYNPTASDYAQGYLTFTLQSTGNCEPEFDTLLVTFQESPSVDAGLDDTYCKNNITSIPLNGTLSFAVGSEWSGGTGGSFGDISDLSTSYTPSPADLAEDSLLIFLTSSGSFFACPDDEDTVVIYFTDPPQVTAGPNITACANDTSVALNGSVTGASTTGIWTTSGSGAFDPSELDLITDYLISSADTTAGSVTLVLTSTANGSCLAVSDSLELTILDQPQLNITTSDSICANSVFIDLTGTVSAGYSTNWSVGGFGTIADPNSLNTTYILSPLDTIGGTMTIYLSTTPGLCPVENDSLEIQFIAPPTADAGPDQDFCENESAVLTGLIGGSASSGTWSSLGTGSFNPGPDLLNTFYDPSPLDVSNGSVQLILTTSAEFGCVADKDTILISYLEAPEANFDHTSACEGQNTVFDDLSTTGSGTIVGWNWDFGDGESSIGENPNHPYPGPGNYTVTLISEASNGCFDTISRAIYVNPVPVPNFSHSDACEGETVEFADNSFISGGNIVSWDWDFNSGEGNSSAQNPNYTFDQAGTFPVVFTVTSDSGCVAELTQDIVVLVGPTADFTVNPMPALALEDIVFTDLSTGGPFTNWFWDFGDGTGGNDQHEIHQYQNGGMYDVTLEVTDSAGCRDATTQPLEIVLLPQLPTAFTPNGDGENDVYIIRGGPFEATDFKIYNNWGQLVFATDDANVGWDGTFKGSDAPLGVYTWTFTIKIAGNRTVIKEGDVTLIR
jgi:gliding motility-associated-like protein